MESFAQNVTAARFLDHMHNFVHACYTLRRVCPPSTGILILTFFEGDIATYRFNGTHCAATHTKDSSSSFSGGE